MNCKNLLQFVTVSLLALFTATGIGASGALAQQVYWDTYYVDADYTGTENGTEDQPYNTIGEAIDVAVDNDFIKVEADTYDEYVEIDDNINFYVTDDPDEDGTQTTLDVVDGIDIQGDIAVGAPSQIDGPITINTSGDDADLSIRSDAELVLVQDLTVDNVGMYSVTQNGGINWAAISLNGYALTFSNPETLYGNIGGGTIDGAVEIGVLTLTGDLVLEDAIELKGELDLNTYTLTAPTIDITDPYAEYSIDNGTMVGDVVITDPGKTIPLAETGDVVIDGSILFEEATVTTENGDIVLADGTTVTVSDGVDLSGATFAVAGAGTADPATYNLHYTGSSDIQVGPEWISSVTLDPDNTDNTGDESDVAAIEDLTIAIDGDHAVTGVGATLLEGILMVTAGDTLIIPVSYLGLTGEGTTHTIDGVVNGSGSIWISQDNITISGSADTRLAWVAVGPDVTGAVVDGIDTFGTVSVFDQSTLDLGGGDVTITNQLFIDGDDPTNATDGVGTLTGVGRITLGRKGASSTLNLNGTSVEHLAIVGSELRMVSDAEVTGSFQADTSLTIEPYYSCTLTLSGSDVILGPGVTFTDANNFDLNVTLTGPSAITAQGDASFTDLTINHSGTTTFQTDGDKPATVTIHGAYLQKSGNIDLGDHNLTIANTGSFEIQSGQIISEAGFLTLAGVDPTIANELVVGKLAITTGKVTSSDPITVSDSLRLETDLAVGGAALTIGKGGAIIVDGGALVNAPTFEAPKTVSVTYRSNATTGVELPDTLSTLIVDADVTLGRNATVRDSLVLEENAALELDYDIDGDKKDEGLVLRVMGDVRAKTNSSVVSPDIDAIPDDLGGDAVDAGLLVFTGDADQTITLDGNYAGLNVPVMLDKPSGTVTVDGGNLDLTDSDGSAAGDQSFVSLEGGLLAASGGSKIILGGFDREVADTAASHIIGPITRAVQSSGTYTFPTGSKEGRYRPFTIGNPGGSGTVTVSHHDRKPGGTNGLPIESGEATIKGWSPFYWSIVAGGDISGSSMTYKVQAEGYGETGAYENAGSLRIIRRFEGSSSNTWSLVGAAENYTNFEAGEQTPLIKVTKTTAGLTKTARVFAIGAPTTVALGPSFTAAPDTITVSPGDTSEVSFAAKAAGDASTIVSYTLSSSAPAYVSIDAATGLVMAAPSMEAAGEEVIFQVTATGSEGYAASVEVMLIVSTANVRPMPVAELPESFTLYGNYPNPFNPTTNLRFDLPVRASVSVTVYNMLGRKVMALPQQAMSPGAAKTVSIDASHLSSGMYIYRVMARSAEKVMVDTGTMMLVK